MEFNILLSKYIPSDKNASQKAPEDIEKIFKANYGCTYRVRYTDNPLFSYFDTLRSAWKIRTIKKKANCNIIVQWPLYVKRPLSYRMYLSHEFNTKIAIIHDLDSLRFSPNNKSIIKKEISSLNRFDYVIAHNKSMRRWLIRNGLKADIITLDIFDYLLDGTINIDHSNDYRIVVAGNLDKSIFLKEIDKVLSYRINAYGPISSYQLPDNIEYKGVFLPDQLPYHIEGEFGLIWDGEDTDNCSGKNGNYMRYNNPHKLSLYVACGMPVITWKKAAIAEYVETNDIGFTVNSLHEVNGILDNLSAERYRELLSNVKKITSTVTTGTNFICAFEKVTRGGQNNV